MINSHCPKQSAQPQTLFTGDAEIKVLLFAGVVVGGFFFNGKIQSGMCQDSMKSTKCN